MSKTNRRSFLGKGASAAIAAGVAAVPAAAQSQSGPTKKVVVPGGKSPFNEVITYGNVVFVAGVGAHFPGDIKAHTKHVLDQIQKNLEAAGSSMEKVLKCQVYLADLKDYAAMNEAFRGRFGPEPPVRTTVAVAGLPGNSLVEIDVIAYV